MAEKKSATKKSTSKKKTEEASSLSGLWSDGTFRWAVLFIAGVAVFMAGFGIGHAVGEDANDDGRFGADVVDDRRLEHEDRRGHDLDQRGRFDDRRDRFDRFDERRGDRRPGSDQEVEELCEVSRFSDDFFGEEGFLGIRGAAADEGVVVRQVMPFGPAFCAGIQSGDRILVFGGERVMSIEHLADLVTDRAPGSEVVVVVDGPSGQHELVVVLGARHPVTG